MSKIMNTTLATAAALAALVTAVPTASMAQSNGITSCDAPGGRQATGAVIGAVIGGVVGSNLARNERTAGTVVGAGAGAAAGSYIGCNQQRARANADAQSSTGALYATTTLRVRSGPGTNYRQTGSVNRGQALQAVSSQGEWVQLSSGGWVNANYLTR